MSDTEKFKKSIEEGNSFKGDFITLGAAMLNGEVLKNAYVNVPLKR